MSDNCECGKHAIDIDCVTGKVDVKWSVTDPGTVSGLFVRKKFRTTHDTYDFVSLKPAEDFRCGCADRLPAFEACRREYLIGDMVMAQVHNSDLHEDVLEPAQVVDFKLDMERVILRRLRRRKSAGPTSPPNELEVTEELFDVGPTKVIRKCYVRFFSADAVAGGLPTPYNRNGTGDFYFIVGEPDENEGEESYDIDMADTDSLPPIEQGPDIAGPAPFEKLTGMGIFCGGGNFDRGLEDAGAVEFKYAVDYAERAIYSYQANASDSTHCFYGSVNDYLTQAMAGSPDPVIATIGMIGFLSGGSPCPGFSRMQTNQLSDTSLRNASLVASFISFVDLYSPTYCMLENVIPMTQGMGPRKDENVFKRALAALVAMGYQVQQFHMDAWSVGSSQSRSRVFIAASAPGLEPLPLPAHTHGHPSELTVRKQSLGKSSNGLNFGKRRVECTPFLHVSAADSTADLPDISDSQVQLCPCFPDHRTPSEEVPDRRSLIAMIPKHPQGMGLVQAARQGLLSGGPLEYYINRTSIHNERDVAESYSRMKPNRLFQTVMTVQHLACRFQGRSIHWTQDRAATVLEYRRAQGVPDHEVILGSPRQQVVIIGNSVDRNVSLALGLSVRASWLKSHENGASALRISQNTGSDDEDEYRDEDYAAVVDPAIEMEDDAQFWGVRGLQDYAAVKDPTIEMMEDAQFWGVRGLQDYAAVEDTATEIEGDTQLWGVRGLQDFQAQAGPSNLSVQHGTMAEHDNALRGVSLARSLSVRAMPKTVPTRTQQHSTNLPQTPQASESHEREETIVVTSSGISGITGSERGPEASLPTPQRIVRRDPIVVIE